MLGLRRVGILGLAAGALALFGSRADAQQQSYYGFAVAQNQLGGLGPGLAASALAQVPGCAPTTPAGGCAPTYVGCRITYCLPQPYTCGNLPTGGTSPICNVVCDQPPIKPEITLTVWKNYYVPIYITNNTPPDVQPVNIDVKYREIHYLSDANGKPIDREGQPLNNPPGVIPPVGTNPSAPAASAPAPPPAPASQQGAAADAPSAASVLALSKPATPAPQPAAAVETTPAKQWVWLSEQNVYGYGYRRADGYWVIDKGSKRPTPPEAQSAAAPATASVPMGTVTASN